MIDQIDLVERERERLHNALQAWLAGKTAVALDDAVRIAYNNGAASATGLSVSAYLRQRGFRKVGFANTGYDRTPLYRRAFA